MKKISIFVFLIFTSFYSSAQFTCKAEDSLRVKEILKKARLKDWKSQPTGDLVVQVGKELLGIPYVAKTLEVNGVNEKLVVNFSGLDCTTFLENAVVFTRLIKQKKYEFSDYLKELENIRYQNGNLDGYSSRLHYFSDWVREKSSLGIVMNVGELVGTTYNKSLNFMSEHRGSYAQLAKESELAKIKKYEETLENSSISHIPQEKIEGLENLVQDGDLIAFTTNLEGLDVTHVAIALEKEGRLYFMHASSKSNKVEISDLTVADYVNGRKILTGIMLARLL